MEEVTKLTLAVDSSQVRSADRDLDNMAAAGGRAEKSAASLSNGFRLLSGAVAAVGVTVTAREFIQLADASALVTAKLSLVVSGTAALARTQAELFDVAQRTRVGFVQTADLYGSLARSTQALGVSQRQVIGVTESINKALQISGASAASSAAALIQLGQGFASGVLRGEELNSVLEQAPRLAQAIADGLNVPLGQLRKLGEQGKLTSEAVFGALERSSAGIAAEFEKIPLTVGSAITQSQNAFLKLVGVIDQTSGASSSLAQAISDISLSVGTLADEITRAGRGETGVGLLASAFQTVSETLRVLGANVAFVFGGIGREAAAVFAQLELVGELLFTPPGQLIQKAKENWAKFTAISDAVRDDARRARAELDAVEQRILSGEKATRAALEAQRKAEDRGFVPTPRATAVAGATTAGKVSEAERYADSLRNQLLTVRDLTAVERLLEEIQSGRLKGTTTAERARLMRLAQQVDAVKRLKDEEQAAAKVAADRSQARQDEARAIQEFEAAQVLSAKRSLQSVRDRVSALEAEEEATALASKSNISLSEAVERVGIARLREKQTQFLEGSERFQEIEREIAARERLVTVINGQQSRIAAEKTATDAVKAFDNAYNQITQGLTDALIKGGKSFADYIKGLFRTLVLRPIIEPLIRPIAGILAGTGSTGALAAGSDALGLAGAVGKLGQIPSLLSNGFSAITGGFQNSILRLGDVLATSQSSLANSLGGFLQTNFAGLGTIAGGLAGFGIGRAAGQLIGGGFGFGNSGNSTINAGGAVGAAIGSIVPGIGTAIGAALGSALGGVVNRLFGRRLADSGIEGSLGGSQGFAGNSFQFFEGGLFRSDKTERSALDPQVSSVLRDGVRLLQETTAGYVEALGLPADAVRSFAQDIRLSFKDLSEEQIGALVEETVGKFGAALVQPLAAQLAPFTKQGEDAAATLARLADAITGVNPVLRELGQSVFAVGIQGADAASQLLDAFGGASNFASLSSSYYEKFFSEQERAARGTQILAEQFAAYGAELPKTRDAFRALVESQDLTTEGGRKAFAALLGVAGAFDEILTATEGAGNSVAELAQALTDFRASLAETIDATRLRTLNPGDRVAELRRREGSLFTELATTQDPAAVAEKLQGVILDRIREEAAISEELRRSQIDALQEQIGALGRLRDIALDLSRTTAELAFSDLSPLNFQDQLNAAAALFNSTADKAAQGDVNAAGQVAGALQSYLEEARQFFGSDTRFAAIYDQAVSRANALADQGIALEGPQTDLQRQLDLLQTVQDTSQQELDALLSLQAALRERETVAAKAAADQAAALQAQADAQKVVIEQQQAQIAQAAAIAERQIEQGDILNGLVAQLAGNSRQAIDAGIEP